MSDFKPWRRKFGVVTLLMACLFEVGWVRSRYTHETIKVQTSRSLYIIDSHQGTLVVCRASIANMPPNLGPPFDVIATNMQIRQSNVLDTTYRIGYGIRQGFRWTTTATESIGLGDAIFEDPELTRVGLPGLVYARKSIVEKRHSASQAQEEHFVFVSTAYWPIVISLALLSIYLLFSNPRQRIARA